MYSPKISDDLIPRLYHLGKARKIPMTRLVDGIIRDALKSMLGETEVSPVLATASAGVRDTETRQAA
jgi:hypothetical protein